VTITVDVIVNAIIQSTIAHAILKIAETANVSLIIIGARGINPIKRTSFWEAYLQRCSAMQG
jgi:hypothetical protein